MRPKRIVPRRITLKSGFRGTGANREMSSTPVANAKYHPAANTMMESKISMPLKMSIPNASLTSLTSLTTCGGPFPPIFRFGTILPSLNEFGLVRNW